MFGYPGWITSLAQQEAGCLSSKPWEARNARKGGESALLCLQQTSGCPRMVGNQTCRCHGELCGSCRASWLSRYSCSANASWSLCKTIRDSRLSSNQYLLTTRMMETL